MTGTTITIIGITTSGITVLTLGRALMHGIHHTTEVTMIPGEAHGTTLITAPGGQVLLVSIMEILGGMAITTVGVWAMAIS